MDGRLCDMACMYRIAWFSAAVPALSTLGRTCCGKNLLAAGLSRDFAGGRGSCGQQKQTLGRDGYKKQGTLKSSACGSHQTDMTNKLRVVAQSEARDWRTRICKVAQKQSP